MICLIKIYLGKESGSSSLSRTSLVGLRVGQHLVGILQIIDDLLPALVVRVFGVREGIVVVLCHVLLVHERNLLKQTLQLEVTIGTEKLHLSSTLLDSSIFLISLCQHVE